LYGKIPPAQNVLEADLGCGKFVAWGALRPGVWLGYKEKALCSFARIAKQQTSIKKYYLDCIQLEN
jgi:hypothetical protein